MKGAIIVGTVGLIGMGTVGAAAVLSGAVTLDPAAQAAMGEFMPDLTAEQTKALNEWIAGLPVGQAAMVLLAIVYRGPISHIIVTLTDLAKARAARSLDIEHSLYGGRGGDEHHVRSRGEV